MRSASPELPGTFRAAAVSHAYDVVPVLQGVDLTIRSGRVTALLGENGSGKSTLIKVLTGVVRPLAGTLTLDGEPVAFANPAAALDAGIAVVHQHHQLFPDLSVAENVIGIHVRRPRRRGFPLLADRRAAVERVERVFAQFDIRIDPHWPVGRLGPEERRFVEIARALLEQPHVLILDEPTASLQPAAARQVLDLMRRMRAHGVGLLFVSHRLGEVVDVAEDAVVLRDGRVVAQADAPLAQRELARHVIGERELAPARASRPARAVPAPAEEAAIAFEAGGRMLGAAAGEILGLAGLPESGATHAVCRLAGLRGRARIRREGRAVTVRSPRDSVRAGIGFVPEDRQALGLLGELSVALNLSLPSQREVSVAGVVRRAAMDERASEAAARLEIRCPSVHAPAKALSGGNQQKLVVARWLASGVRVLAIEEPTHGVDIAGKSQIHALLRDFVDQGGTVVLASAEPDELVALCDRLAIFQDGVVEDVVDADELHGPVELEALINGGALSAASALETA
ncbi:MAG TPA: sugar ABC transporter ATP-binding protein [Conexibacter sp.]|nr:sugar ABC transporter ATP-binding protein [Conexibacter sp.]